MVVSSASSCASLFQTGEPQVHMVVKGTFIELVASPSLPELRCRSFSDSHLVGKMEAHGRHMDAQPCASSEASTEFLSDPEDTVATHLDTPMLWPSLPSECMPLQPPEDIFLPMAWECTEAQPEWLMPLDFDGSFFNQAAFGGINFGCDIFGDDDTLTWEWGHCGGYTTTECAPAESLSAFDVDRSTVSDDAGSGGTSPRDADRTTVLLRSLPRDFTRARLVELLEDEGFDGAFDFVYVPIDFSSEASLGYAFVNFVSTGDVRRCWEIFDGLSEWGHQCEGESKACQVMWAEPCQGLAAHVERYRSSPVMHATVPDEWKPAIFQDGVRMPFPPPTKTVSAPKARRRPKDKEEKQGEWVVRCRQDDGS